jgi:hypothetical protein
MTAIPIRERLRTRTGRRTASRTLRSVLLNAASAVALAAVATAAGFLTSNDYVTCGFFALCLFPFLTGPQRRERKGAKR